MKKTVIVVVSILAVVLALVLGYVFLYQKPAEPQPEPEVTEEKPEKEVKKEPEEEPEEEEEEPVYYEREVTGVHNVTVIKGSSYNTVMALIADGCEVCPGVSPNIDAVDLNTPGEYPAVWMIEEEDGTIKELSYAKFKVTVVESDQYNGKAYMVADEFMWDYNNHDAELVDTAKSVIDYHGNGELSYTFYDENGNECSISDANHEGYFMFHWVSSDGCEADQMVYVYAQQ